MNRNLPEPATALANARRVLFAPGRRPWLPFLPLLFALLWVTAACSSSDGAWPRIAREGVLRVGLDPTFPPFETTTESGVTGLDVDLARALAAQMGLQARFVYFGYDGLYDALATEQVDALISALVIVPGRMRDFAYSEPYFNAGEILVRRASATEIRQMVDLDGRRLAVELGAQGHVEATQWAKRLSHLTVLTRASAEEALDAVAAGEADAALVDGVSGRLYLAMHPEKALARAAQPVTVEPYAIVVRIEDERLLAELDRALAELKRNGELDAISSRWMAP